MAKPLTICFNGDRRGPEWHAHSTTTKWIWLIVADRLRQLRLRRSQVVKQRWKHVETGKTIHSRPAWDVPHSPYGLDVAFALIALWLLAGTGLHHLDWPWADDRPSRSTVQRWLARLDPDGELWLQAIRNAVIEHVAPRRMEEILPAGGIPPPEGRARRDQVIAHAGKLRSSAWILQEAAHSLTISIPSLLVVARGSGRSTAQHPPDPSHPPVDREGCASRSTDLSHPRAPQSVSSAGADENPTVLGHDKEVPVPSKKPPSGLALLRYHAISVYLSLDPPRGQRAAILQQLARRPGRCPTADRSSSQQRPCAAGSAGSVRAASPPSRTRLGRAPA